MTRRGSNDYVTLIASLPPLGQLFKASQTPMSRLRLERRLQLLKEEDRTLLARIESVVQWSHQAAPWSDAATVKTAYALLQELPVTLADLVSYRLQVRTCIAALRMRRDRLPAPGPDVEWGFGECRRLVVTHWDTEDFNLRYLYAWLPDASRLIMQGDAVGLERLLLREAWRILDLAAQGHYFDFEAVVIYVMRWNIMDRWSKYDAQQADLRFDELISAGRHRFENMFALQGERH